MPGTCPFTSKACFNTCQLHIQGNCALAVTAIQQANIATALKVIAQSIKKDN